MLHKDNVPANHMSLPRDTQGLFSFSKDQSPEAIVQTLTKFQVPAEETNGENDQCSCGKVKGPKENDRKEAHVSPKNVRIGVCCKWCLCCFNHKLLSKRHSTMAGNP